MGRRKHRKAERRQVHRGSGIDDSVLLAGPLDDDFGSDWDEEPMWAFGGMGGGGPYPLLGRDTPRTLTCGGCREFVEDGDAGRGTCLHPGSGIAFPWSDTPGCDFHTRRR